MVVLVWLFRLFAPRTRSRWHVFLYTALLLLVFFSISSSVFIFVYIDTGRGDRQNEKSGVASDETDGQGGSLDTSVEQAQKHVHFLLVPLDSSGNFATDISGCSIWLASICRLLVHGGKNIVHVFSSQRLPKFTTPRVTSVREAGAMLLDPIMRTPVTVFNSLGAPMGKCEDYRKCTWNLVQAIRSLDDVYKYKKIIVRGPSAGQLASLARVSDLPKKLWVHLVELTPHKDLADVFVQYPDILRGVHSPVHFEGGVFDYCRDSSLTGKVWLPPLVSNQTILGPRMKLKHPEEPTFCIIGTYPDSRAIKDGGDDLYMFSETIDAFASLRRTCPKAKLILHLSYAERTTDKIEKLIKATTGVNLHTNPVTRADADVEWRQWCDFGVVGMRLPDTAEEAQTVRTKLIDLSAQGAVPLVNKFRVHDVILGPDYPFVWSNASELHLAMKESIENAEAYRRASAAVLERLLPLFTEENVYSALEPAFMNSCTMTNRTGG